VRGIIRLSEIKKINTTTALAQRDVSVAKSFVSPMNSKLPVMPLAIILPSQGDTANLPLALDALRQRLHELQEEGLVEDEQDAANKTSEESMLQQVISWMNMGVE